MEEIICGAKSCVKMKTPFACTVYFDSLKDRFIPLSVYFDLKECANR